MSDSPSEQQTSQTTNNRRRIWATTGLTIGAILTLGAAGGAWWTWVFVNERLSPWVSELLSESLNRPVVLGEVERASLVGLQLGPSAIPPTEMDPDELYVESITVRFNPLQLLRRQITPQITLNGVRAYIEQDATGEWVDTEIDLPETEDDEDPLIQVNPAIAIQESEVVLLPFVGAEQTSLPLTIGNINGTVALTQVEVNDPLDQETILDAQEIDLELTAEPEGAGNLIVNGVIRQLDYGKDSAVSTLDRLDANLAIQAQRLEVARLSPVILASLPEAIPLTISEGTLGGNLEVALTPQAAPEVTGTARLDDGAIAIDGLPRIIENIDAQALFQGDQLALENVTAEYANISARAEGVIHVRNGYDISGETSPFELSELLEELDIDLPVETTGTFRAEAVLTGPLADPQVTSQLRSTDITSIDRVQFANVVAELMYRQAVLRLSDLDAEPLDGGSVTGSGNYRFLEPEGLSLQLEGRNILADAIGRTYGLPEAVTLGMIALDADISGPLDDLSAVVNWQAPESNFPTRGTAEIMNSTVRIREALVAVAGGTVSGSGTVAAGQWDADLVAQGVQLGDFEDALQGITLAGTAQLAGSLDDLSLSGIRGDGQVTASLRGGTLDSQVALANGNWDADVQTRNFPIAQFTPGLPIGGLNADGRLAGNVENLTLDAIRGEGTVSAAIAGGTVTSDVRLEDGFWQANGQGNNLQLGQLVPDLQGTGGGTFQLAGNLNNLSLTGMRGEADLILSDGLATAAGLAPQLAAVRSPLNTSLAWNGRELRIDRLETAGLSAQGTLTPELSDPSAPRIAAIDLAVSTRDYALSALPLSFPPALGLTGEATFDGRLTGTPDDLNLAGTLELANLALNELVFEPLLAGDVQFSSDSGLAVALLGQQDEIVVNYELDPQQLNFRVQADETVAIGNTEGDLLQAQVYNFPISALNLPPVGSTPYGILRGEVTFASAAINLKDFTTVGQVNVANLGIGYLGIDRLFGGFTYADGVAAFNNGEIRMADRDAQGNVIPATTRLYELSGRYAFNQVPEIQARLSTEEGQLRDILEILKIRELADLQRGLAPQDGFIPESPEEAERLLTTVPAGNPNGPFLNQLRRLAELLEREVQAERQADSEPLPPLSDLQGAFRGQVNLTATVPDDITARFNIEGRSWQWGPDLTADSVLARGSYQNGLVSLTPLRFAAEGGEKNAFVDLTGSFSLDPADETNRVMLLEAADLPADKIQNLVSLPFRLGGRLGGTATLQGRLVDPTIEGDFELLEGTLNDNPIDQAEADFTYTEARLNLDSKLSLVDAEDPLTLSAQVPYRLPFVERSPSSNDFVVQANIRDEGFALLNLFTQEVNWVSGQGEAVLDLRGSWNGQGIPLPSEESTGSITLAGAEISLSALPTPLTDVTGRVRLDTDTFALVFEGLTDERGVVGQFSEGQLVAQGTFPIFLPLRDVAADNGETAPADGETAPAATINSASDNALSETAPESPTQQPAAPPPITQMPLSLDVEDIALNLKGLYNGRVNGQIVVEGSALFGPDLTGAIDLFRGTITIPEGENTELANSAIPVRFSNLRIALTNNIRIVQGALLNVAGRGGFRLDGDLIDLRPTGIIRLPSGKIELFTTSLRLAGRNDRAEFRGDFDPILDVTLQTALQDVSGSPGIQPTTSPFPRNEIQDTTIDDLVALPQQGSRLVTITARYRGPASEVSDLRTDLSNLELKSSPPRSTNEIISLLSGNVLGAIDSLQGGGDALSGFAAFAGAALLERVREFLGDTIPLSELRIFPVSESSGDVNDSQDIGAEIGFDVRPNISVSVLKVLTDDTPFQYNVRYRLSDQFTLRGTTSFEDFQDRTGVLLEYETRF